MTYIRVLYITLLCAILSSCAGDRPAPAAHQSRYIITVAMPDSSDGGIPSNSDKAYALNGEWNIPLSVRKDVRLLVAHYGLDVVDTWPLDSIREFCIVVADLPPNADDLAADPRVRHVTPIRQFVTMRSTPPYNDANLAAQLGSNVESLNRLHRWSTGKGVSVGIIDGPVDIQHPDLEHRIKSEDIFLPSDPRGPDLMHGTAVAGIIGAEANNHIGIVGFAPDARIQVYAACGYEPDGGRTVCDTFSLAKAIEAATQDGLDVVNMSLAGPYDALLERLIETMIDRGAIVVAADNPSSRKLRFPASMAKVIGASTPGDDRDIAPPPIRVEDEHLTTMTGGGYQFFYGSSMSAARVTALVSLLLERSPGLTPQDTRVSLERIVNTCDGRPPVAACAMRFALVEHNVAFSMNGTP